MTDCWLFFGFHFPNRGKLAGYRSTCTSMSATGEVTSAATIFDDHAVLGLRPCDMDLAIPEPATGLTPTAKLSTAPRASYVAPTLSQKQVTVGLLENP